MFRASGVAFSWASRLPDIKRVLDLTPGELGTPLLAMAAGSVIGLPLSGRIIRTIGTTKTVLSGMASASLGLTAAAIGVDVFHSVPMIWISMFLGGLGIGVWDVAMNHEGAEVERGLGRAIMPWFHAAFSGATVASALLGSLLTWLKVPILVHMIVVVVAVLAVSLRGTSWFLPIEDAEEATAHAQGRPAWFEPRTSSSASSCSPPPSPKVRPTTGSPSRWSRVTICRPGWASWFATFLGFMTIGRLAGTYALDR